MPTRGSYTDKPFSPAMMSQSIHGVVAVTFHAEIPTKLTSATVKELAVDLDGGRNQPSQGEWKDSHSTDSALVE